LTIRLDFDFSKRATALSEKEKVSADEKSLFTTFACSRYRGNERGG
jgi:hypothetical protein